MPSALNQGNLLCMDISSLQDFYHGFYIDASVGNNAFSFAERFHQKIFVAPFIKGTVDDVILGDEIVFSDMVESVEVRTLGLKHFIHMERPGQDIFIFDNHNHAFSCWAAGVQRGVLPEGSTLVHVDQHKDTREPNEWFVSGHAFTRAGLKPAPTSDKNVTGAVLVCRGGSETLPRAALFEYANNVLNVGNFIPPAIKLGWFKDVVQVGDADAFQQDITAPVVLDIDLDIFAPVMDYIPAAFKIERLRAWIARSSFITMATSPFFMDQNKAIDLVKVLLEV